MPNISIVIPAYDNVVNLPACLDSVLGQGYQDWEAIVVVDGSPDGSAEIVRRYAKKDRRIVLVDKVDNEGTHRARMSGVEAASGNYLLFLDADDELAPCGLERLARLADEEPLTEVIHFGMEQLDAGVSREMYEGFLENCNRHFPDLAGVDIAKSSFVFGDEPVQDWRVLQRLYKGELVKKAFDAMTRDRLGRGQDAYEWLVIASLAKRESFHNDVIAYRYYFGRGITNTTAMSSEKFGKLSQTYAETMEAARKWAGKSGLPQVALCAEGLSSRLCELLFGDWLERVPDNEKETALSQAASSIGGVAVAAELMRLSRDEAYAHWDAGDIYDPSARYVRLFDLGERFAAGREPSGRYIAFRDAARGHIADLQGRSRRTTWLDAVRRAKCFFRR